MSISAVVRWSNSGPLQARWGTLLWVWLAGGISDLLQARQGTISRVLVGRLRRRRRQCSRWLGKALHKPWRLEESTLMEITHQWTLECNHKIFRITDVDLRMVGPECSRRVLLALMLQFLNEAIYSIQNHLQHRSKIKIKRKIRQIAQAQLKLVKMVAKLVKNPGDTQWKIKWTTTWWNNSNHCAAMTTLTH